MTPQTRSIILTGACATVAVWSVAQWGEIGKLRRENDELRKSVAAHKAARPLIPTRDGTASSHAPETVETSPAPENADGPAPTVRTRRPRTVSQIGDAVAQEGFTPARAEADDSSLATFEPSLFISSFEPAVEVSQPVVAGKVHWDHGQATGAPDTAQAGDHPTAWAPRSPRSGEQWLALGYENPVEISEINIHESHSTGAISKVTVLLPDGSEKTLWSGVAKPGTPHEILETSLPVPPGITGNQIKIYVDTNRVQSWPEIDAVELVGANGQRQWANRSQASSSYSETYGAGVATPPDPATAPGPTQLVPAPKP